MSAQPIEVRMAHLEGVLDQVVERLGSIDRRLDGMEVRFDTRLGRIDQVLESRFTWLIGLMLGTWVSLMLAVLFHK
ncbi:MAG: hypothetical protein ABSE64_07510 [Vulcanimicrobiaceae bacterium]|jgi:tetrahydromethanopterin S-methyltransferase subunit G